MVLTRRQFIKIAGIMALSGCISRQSNVSKVNDTLFDINKTSIPTSTKFADVYGSSDSYIQKAIDSNPGKIIMTHGNYEIYDSIVLPSDCTLVIDGKLKANKILDRKPIIRNSDINKGNSNITISGGEIDGNKSNISCLGTETGEETCSTILMTAEAGAKNNNIKIENCYIHDAPRTGIQFINTFNSDILNSTFKNNDWMCIDIYLKNGLDSWLPVYDTVDNCVFDNNAGAVTPGFSRNITVKKSKISRCTNFGIFCDGSSKTYISDNIFDDCKPAAIAGDCTVGAPVSELHITDNSIKNSPRGIQISCGGLGGHKITGNECSNVPIGIYITSGNLRNGTVISGNKCTIVKVDDPYWL